MNLFLGLIAIITLAWDAPTTNADGTPLTDLSHYEVSYGPSTRTYTVDLPVGNVTTVNFSFPSPGKHYVAVRAVDLSGNKSEFSNELLVEIPSPSPSVSPSPEPVSTETPSPSPTPIETPTPAPTPKPSPSAKPSVSPSPPWTCTDFMSQYSALKGKYEANVKIAADYLKRLKECEMK